MKAARRALVLLISPLILAGCDDGSRQRLENEMFLMQERLVELETQVADAQEHANRMSAAVQQLDAYFGDVETEVIELSALVPRHQLVNVEATLGNAKTKLEEVGARSEALNNTLRPAFGEQ